MLKEYSTLQSPFVLTQPPVDASSLLPPSSLSPLSPPSISSIPPLSSLCPPSLLPLSPLSLLCPPSLPSLLPLSSPSGRNIYRVVFRTGVVERNELFLPGRMAYVVDLDDEFTDTDIPTTLIRSKADCPSMEVLKHLCHRSQVCSECLSSFR